MVPVKLHQAIPEYAKRPTLSLLAIDACDSTTAGGTVPSG